MTPLGAGLPRCLLATLPTPLVAAPGLSEAVGVEVWIKRDDLVGLGGGGNKVRKLQYTCAEALEAGATTLITMGAPQSNHARLTAAAAARLGLRCVLVLSGPAPMTNRGNLILDALAGAEIVWAEDQPLDKVAAAEAERRPGSHIIAFGGSSPTFDSCSPLTGSSSSSATPPTSTRC